MSTDIVNVGTAPNSGNGDQLRRAFQALNVRLQQIAALLNNRGAWQTATAYSASARDWVMESGQAYIAAVDHTSGTFATDLAAGKWLAVDVAQLILDLAEADDAKGAALVAFLQSGANSVARTLQDKARERITVADFDTFANAMTAASGKSLRIIAPIAIPASITIPQTVELKFDRGGSLVPASGQTVTLNGPLDAGLFKILDKSAGGSFTAGNSFKEEVPPEWFGALGDSSTDDTTALQATLDFCDTPTLQKRRMILSAKAYMFSNLELEDQAYILGQGMWNSLLKRIPGSTGIGITDRGSATKITLVGFMTDCNGVNAVGLELGFNGVQWGNEGFFDDFGVRDAGSATPARINGNVGQIKSMLVQTSGTSNPVMYLTGGANRADVLVVVSTGLSAVGLELRGGSTIIDKLHIEGQLTTPLVVNGPDNYIKHYSFSAGSGLTVNAVVHFPAVADVRNTIDHCFVIPSTATFTNMVLDDNTATAWAWNASWPHFRYSQGGATRFVSQTGIATFPTATSVAVSFARTEPNASYRIALSPLANQTMWVTSKTTSGFTLNTDTAGSTASCEYTVMR